MTLILRVTLTKNSVQSTREKDIYVTLYDFDFAFNRYNDEISDFTRRHVDHMVSEYLQRGIAQFVCSGLYIENSNCLSPLNIFRLLNSSELYPHLKILVDNSTSEVLLNNFLFINTINTEQPADLLEYFCKNLKNPELKAAVSGVLTFENYESVMNVLNMCSSPAEFTELFN